MIRKGLKAISVGKHNQGLYLKDRRFFSTSFGGIVTLLIIFAMMIFTISELVSIFRREQYIITYNLMTENSFAFE